MIRASIDLGTNTCLLLVAQWDSDSQLVTQTLLDRSTVVRLGQKVDQTRCLQPEAVERTMDCLRRYVEDLRSFEIAPEAVIAVATSQARDAKNGSEFFSRVQKELGIQFRVLSGEEEARFSFLGALIDQAPDQAAVIDIGGGSTEIVSEHGGKSIDVGSVRFTERFFQNNPVLDQEFWACREAIDDSLEKLLSWKEKWPRELELVGVAGTIVTLGQLFLGLLHFDREKLEGLTLTRGDLHRLVEELKWRSVQERIDLGIEEGRADVILAGAMILWRTLEVLRFPQVTLSTRGLRYGILSLE